jgi:isopenicillin-N N-acyltransferase-like protein
MSFRINKSQISLNPIAWRIALCIAILFASQVQAAEPSRYTPAEYKTGKLQFIEGIPVVTISGTPEEMGEQLGVLCKTPLQNLLSKKDEIAHGLGLQQAPNILVKSSRLAVGSFPENQRRELTALAKTAQVDFDTLAFANIMYEVSHFPACSTLAIEPNRSSTGHALFGRNFDFPSFGFLDKYSMVLVERPESKHAYASVGFPGVVGVFSGMNDAGLCLAQLEVNYSADHSARVNLLGTPVSMCFRRILEECATVDEAEALLRKQNRMMMCNLALCDKQTAAVLEITPKTIARRDAASGLCPCTNHFRTKELAVDTHCDRYTALMKSTSLPQVSVSDLAKLLDSANQKQFTIQTMIFEPDNLTAHISFGAPPSSSKPLKTIDLAKLLHPTTETAASANAD